MTNPHYVPKFMSYLLKNILPFYPLWSRYLQIILFPKKENPLSNSPSEVMHKLDKEESFEEKSYQELTNVMVELLEGAEERLLEVKYPTDFTKNTKRGLQNEHDEDPMNVPVEEIWKKN